MSERNQSVSQAVQELTAKVETWEAELAAWPPAVGESVGRALQAAQEQAEERSKSEAREWTQVGRAWRQEMQGQLQRLTALTERQAQVIQRYEHESAPWVLTWSRARWREVAANVAATLGLSIILLTLFWWTGPPARDRAALEAARAELTTYRGMWNAMTGAEQQEINKRIQAPVQETGQ